MDHEGKQSSNGGEGFGGLAVDIHRFNERVAADERFEATILPAGDGLMVAVRAGDSDQ